ncbi:xanthine dehydrogenase family protein molybdopterin-binding subunit [Aquabacter sp. CN5-332]|uniref:xanthine dehydrogenase family protein molybdopterin-binding subunit n=1 Tax=Aquabacter sp. CN5-332 TaxID=3156608 RepID=UPI0032B579DF
MNPRPNAYVGAPIERVEDYRFLRGEGTYVADLARADSFHAVILRSPVAHGVIRRIDASEALGMLGVRAVITAAEIGERPKIPLRQTIIPEGEPYYQPVIATGHVRYVGEPIAVVVAQSAALAEDALEHIALEIDPLPVVAGTQAALADETLLFEASGTNKTVVFHARCGDADAAFATAPYVRRERFKIQRHTALPMEPRGLFAEWKDEAGQLIVWGAAKVPFFNRALLARMLGLDKAQVEMMEVDVGGGFGARGEFYPEDFLIPFAAFHVGGSVAWSEDRREHLIAMNHAREMEADVEIACASDGMVLGLRGNVDVDTGAYVRTNGFTPPRNVAQFMSGPYRVPNIHVSATVLVTNKTPAGTYRGPGRYESAFCFERLLDHAAADLGVDRAEIRRRNLVSEAEMPYPLAPMGHADNMTQTRCDGGAYAELMDNCLAAFGWEEKLALNGKLIDGRHHGIALGNYIEGGASGPSEAARMDLEADGSVSLYVGSSGLGQGVETILIQIAADALEIPMERLRIFHGSTTLVKQGYGSFHSRSTVMGGNAVVLAATALKDALRATAAARHGCAAEDVCVSDGLVHVPGRPALGFVAFGAERISVERDFFNTTLTYSYGAHAAHVAVDPKTGHVEVLDYLAVDDVGRVINPLTLHGQVIGALVQGLGSTFLEELRYDEDGQALTGSLADYLLPTASDFPHLRAHSLELRACPNNPLGVKGAGEGGLISVGGVIANAIAAAFPGLDLKPNQLPLSPERVWGLIAEAKASKKRAA